MKLDRTLWLTADRDRVVEEGDPEAAYLLGTAGKEIPDDEAKRLGLSGKSKTSEAAPAEEKESEPADNKQAAAPANKARKTTKKKG